MHAQRGAACGAARPPCARHLPRAQCTPRASLATHEAHPLHGGAGGGLSAPLAALKGGGVFAVYDAAGALAYMGNTRSLAGSLAALAAAFAADEAASAKAKPLPNASAAALQAEWLAWVKQHGSIPPGNAPGADARWAARPRAAAAAPAAPPRAADTDFARWRAAAVDALVTADVARLLDARGFVVLDDALDAATCVGARRAARALDAAGVLRGIPLQAAQGRRDRSAAVALHAPHAPAVSAGFGGAPLPAGAAAGGGDGDAACLAAVASLLMAVPHALQARRGSARGVALAPPQSLQLALYDGDGSYYARHVDNPGADAPGASDGPPGLRTGDRAVTAIVYFNPDWQPAHGGELRLWPPDSASGGAPAADVEHVDVAPVAGRLLLFDAVRVEHEVRPSRAERWALSAWIPRADSCV